MDYQSPPSVERLTLLPPSGSSSDLRDKAQQILTAYQTKPSISLLPDTLRELLIQIIKPLFSTDQHPALAPSGRKAQFGPAPTIPHASPLTLDDSDKPWKLSFTTLTYPILSSILSTYPTLPPETLKPTIEQQIFLLTPALLNLIDDVSPVSKAAGFRLLSHLGTAILAAGSNILKTSGITDVFIDAIKPNFMLLPSLTSEDDSLVILRELYPAYLSLIQARYQHIRDIPTVANHAADDGKRYNYLLLAFRHGLIASLTHLGAGLNTSHVPLTTFLVSQLTVYVRAMDIYITAHLREILPLLRKVLCDPFATAAPELILETFAAMQAVSQVAPPPRFQNDWWREVLRGCIGCWNSVVDDEEAAADARSSSTAITTKAAELRSVKERCRETMKVLEAAADAGSWRNARATLLKAEPGLEGLYEY